MALWELLAGRRCGSGCVVVTWKLDSKKVTRAKKHPCRPCWRQMVNSDSSSRDSSVGRHAAVNVSVNCLKAHPASSRTAGRRLVEKYTLSLEVVTLSYTLDATSPLIYDVSGSSLPHPPPLPSTGTADLEIANRQKHLNERCSVSLSQSLPLITNERFMYIFEVDFEVDLMSCLRSKE